MTETQDAERIEAMESLPAFTIFTVALILDELRAAGREETLEAAQTRIANAEDLLTKVLDQAKKADPNVTESL
jgi:hypothetical protein